MQQEYIKVHMCLYAHTYICLNALGIFMYKKHLVYKNIRYYYTQKMLNSSARLKEIPTYQYY